MDRSFCALQNQLNERFSDEERSQLSRHNILDLMIILKNFVGSCMDEHLGELECGTAALSQTEADKCGVTDPALRRSLVRLDTGKANRTPLAEATWIKLESQCLDNGDERGPADYVGVARVWKKPDVFHGMSTWHLYMVQQELAASDWRENAQANDWVGYLVARVAGLWWSCHSRRNEH